MDELCILAYLYMKKTLCFTWFYPMYASIHIKAFTGTLVPHPWGIPETVHPKEGVFDKLWEGVANAFRLLFSKFSLFCQKVNWNDDLKESES